MSEITKNDQNIWFVDGNPVCHLREFRYNKLRVLSEIADDMG